MTVMGETPKCREGGACVHTCVGPGIAMKEEHSDISLGNQIHQIHSVFLIYPCCDLSSPWSKLVATYSVIFTHISCKLYEIRSKALLSN
jgi:hypothetical protein